MARNKKGIHYLIRSPSNASEKKLARALYKSIEKAYNNFQVEIQNLLVNEKSEKWRAVNAGYFNIIEDFLHQNEFWAS